MNNIELTQGEERMLEHARAGAESVGAVLKPPLDREQLRLAKRTLQQAHATLEFLLTHNNQGIEQQRREDAKVTASRPPGRN